MEITTFQIASCSGASNTGKFADEVARMLSTSGKANMICLAKVAVGDQPLINNIKSHNTKIVVLDGCPVNCAEKILGKEGINNIIHINTTDFGIVKGKTVVLKKQKKSPITLKKQPDENHK